MGEQPDKWILIDTKKRQLHFCEHEWTKATYSIGVGREETPTPTGNFYIYEMCENPKKAYREGPLPIEIYGTRSIELSIMAFDFDLWVWRNFSIHGTDDDSVIGTRCSAGCVRMRNADVEELYENIEVGIPVILV